MAARAPEFWGGVAAGTTTGVFDEGAAYLALVFRELPLLRVTVKAAGADDLFRVLMGEHVAPHANSPRSTTWMWRF